MKLKKFKTKKLFYGKWPYKIEMHVQGANLVRIRGVDTVKNLCLGDGQGLIGFRYREINDKHKLLRFAELVEECLDERVQFRTEYDTFTIFVKDLEHYQLLSKKFKEFVVSVTEPENDQELQTLLNNNKYIICDDLPKGKYKYRVTFKSKIPLTVRKNLAGWLKKYDDSKIELPGSNLRRLNGDKLWWTNCFIYVSDESMLMLLNLAAHGYIRKTEEFKPRSSINTSLQTQ